MNLFNQRYSSATNTNQAPLASAPGDLLIEIAHLLDSRQDIFNLSLTSSHIFSHISSVLYETVELTNVEQYSTTLGMLQRRVDIARHVRELIIRPQSHTNTDLKNFDRDVASLAVASIAGSKCLDALVKFTWDVDELPLHDDMWFALRMGCPQLKYVGSTIGTILPSLNSHLFDFVDLIGFSLLLKKGFYLCHNDLFLDEDSPTFLKFWDMLIRSCPNLEELTIDGVSMVPSDVHYLVEGRWPKLKSLTLGDVCVDWIPRPVFTDEKRPFIVFLEAHPNLQSLSLSYNTIQPYQFRLLDPSSLGSIKSFSGTFQQLQALPQLHPYLEKVTFRESVETREVSAPTVASLLRDMTSLTELRISFLLHSMYDSGNLLRSLIQSCPNLRHLELTCAHKPSFQLDAFAKTIRGFPKLRTLHLTIVRYPGDENLAAGAARIAKSNPRLKQFTLTFIPPVYPVALPFAISYRPFPFPARASGTFELSCDEHGLPIALKAVEHSRHVWPWGLGESSSTKKYVQDLRPLSSPERRKKGLNGVVELLFERSAAGEEMRMIIFCWLLVCLAVWGFAASGSNPRHQPRSSPLSIAT